MARGNGQAGRGWRWWASGVVVVAGLAAGVAVLWVHAPALYASTPVEHGRAQAVALTRTGVLTAGAALLALAGVAANLAETRRANNQTRDRDRLTHERELAEQLADRYTAAVGHLGSATLDVRLGGIYALEQIAVDSENHHRTVVEVLSAFVREHTTPGRPGALHRQRDHPATDPPAGTGGSTSPELSPSTLNTRWSTNLGDDHPDHQNITTALADILAALGQHAVARPLLEDILARHRRLYGDSDIRTVISAANVADLLIDLGEHRVAHDLAVDALARMRELLGPDNPTTLASAINLARNLAGIGDLQAARSLAADTLIRLRRLLGPDHLLTLISASNLATYLARLLELDAARELAEDTLARRRRLLGPDHPDTLTSVGNLANLAQVLRAFGKNPEAVRLEEEVLRWS
jgi:hypothetical protein